MLNNNDLSQRYDVHNTEGNDRLSRNNNKDTKISRKIVNNFN